MALREQIKDAVAKHSDKAVGLADNGNVQFQCGTCEYYDPDGSFCTNAHPKLDGTDVKAEWCCNLYHHKGMKVVIA